MENSRVRERDGEQQRDCCRQPLRYEQRPWAGRSPGCKPREHLLSPSCGILDPSPALLLPLPLLGLCRQARAVCRLCADCAPTVRRLCADPGRQPWPPIRRCDDDDDDDDEANDDSDDDDDGGGAQGEPETSGFTHVLGFRLCARVRATGVANGIMRNVGWTFE